MFIKASRLRAHSSCQNLDCPSGRRPLIRSRTLGFLVSSAAPGGVQAAGSEDEDEDDAKRVVVGAMVIPGGHTLDTRAASAVAAGLRANIRSCSLSLSLSLPRAVQGLGLLGLVLLPLRRRLLRSPPRPPLPLSSRAGGRQADAWVVVVLTGCAARHSLIVVTFLG